MHVAEQPAEVSACVEEYGRTPVALLETEGLLSERFTAVHAIHVTPKAIPSFARTGAMVCACPTTERNLGDGVVPAHEYFKHGVQVCLGTDSLASISKVHGKAPKLNMFAEMKTLASLEPELAPQAILEMATTKPARALKHEGELGILDEGARADVIVVPFSGRSETVHETLVHFEGPVRGSMIDGRWAITPN